MRKRIVASATLGCLLPLTLGPVCQNSPQPTVTTPPIEPTPTIPDLNELPDNPPPPAQPPVTVRPPSEPPIVRPPAPPPPLPAIPPVAIAPEPPPAPPVVIVEPEPPLLALGCSFFPPLPITAVPENQITYPISPTETTYFWETIFCPDIDELDENDNSSNADGQICEEINIGNSLLGYDDYHLIARLNSLPHTLAGNDQMFLRLFLLEGEWFFYFYLSFERLTTPWWQDCPVNHDLWQADCGDGTLPIIQSESLELDWYRDGEENRWVNIEITDLYRDWQLDPTANHELMISAGFLDKLVFATANYPEPTLWPHLLVVQPARETTLFFPLDGPYDENRITGYDFGDWWLSKRCDPEDPRSPRLRHTGIDLNAWAGDPVYAVHDGLVRYARTSPEEGGYIVLEHDNQWTSTYTHTVPAVAESENGQPVFIPRGEQIGWVASIAKPHLHFQIRYRPYEEPWSRRGRLPDVQCLVKEQGITEPGFPENFLDPKCLNWE